MKSYSEEEIAGHDLDWFVNHLKNENGFRLVSNNKNDKILIYDNTTNSNDIITVFIHPAIVIITAGGDRVIPSFNIMERCNGSEIFWTELLQIVLHKF